MLKEKDIKELCIFNAYSRGKRLYSNNHVQDLEFIVEEIQDNKEIKISAFVESESMSGGYSVEAILNDKKNNLKFKCSCSAFHQYSGLGCCKHVAAVLVKFYSENKELVSEPIQTHLEEIISELVNIEVNEDYKDYLNLEITYNEDYLQSVEFKIGINKLYVIKNLEEFVECIKDKRELIFGKGFIFNLKTQRFRDEDLNIIDFLIEMSDIHGIVGKLTGFWNKTFIKGKNLYVTGKIKTKFFNLIKGRRIKFNNYDKKYNDIEVIERDLPLNISVTQDTKGISVSLEDQPPIPLDNNRVYSHNDKIYIISQEQADIYKVLNKYLHKKKEIVFNNIEGEKVVTKIIPALSKASEKLNISKSLKEKIVSEPLKAAVFLDKDRDNIVAKVEFSYGEFVVNKSNENKIDRFIIRDELNERKVIDHLERFNFKEDKERYILSGEEDIVDYIDRGVKELQEFSEVYYSEEFKKVKVYNTSSLKTTIALNDNQLLEFNFDIPHVSKEEIKNIFKSFKEKKRFYKLKDGGFLAIQSSQIYDLNSMMNYVGVNNKDIKDGKFTISKNYLVYINDTLRDSSIKNIIKDKKVREIINNIKEMKEVDYPLSKEFDSIMRDYQKVGYNWFKTLSTYGFGGILADEMGLGKTLQTIAFLSSEAFDKPSLVITPTSLIYNWEREFQKFAPSIKVIVISGDKSLREQQLKEIDSYDVILTSYPLLTRDIDLYKELSFRYCVIDEAQKIKNYDTLTAKAVKDVKAVGRFALTGTPIENSLTELWSIFDFIMPGYLFTNKKFLYTYEMPVMKNNDKNMFGELNKKIRPFILRRKKSDVALELPPKIEQKIYIELMEEQKKLYMSYIASLKGEIDEEIKEKGFNKSKIKILAALTRLRQICCDPSTFIEDYNGESAKIKALEDLLEEILSDGHKVLIFSQFTSVLKNIGKVLKDSDINFSYLDGSVKSEERMKTIDEFNHGENEVFLISLKAGGTGLNLTSADIVIHFDPWWNPSVEEQASDRAHRIGQDKTVEVIKLISKGTIEEKINLIQERKKEVIKNVLDSDTNEDNIISNMSYDEIEELFKY